MVFFLFHQTITSAKVERMLALVVARHGPVRDGLVALLEASPDISKIVQVKKAQSAWEFAQDLCPDITLIYSPSLAPDLVDLIRNLSGSCSNPIMAIVGSEEDRKTAVACGVDIGLMEGLPSTKLAVYIAQLIPQGIEKE